MRMIAMLATAGVLLLSDFSYAGACLAIPQDLTDRNVFVGRVIDSLESFSEARSKLITIEKSKSGSDFISAIYDAQRNLACADERLSGYEHSPNEAIKVAATGFKSAASVVIQSNEEFRVAFVDRLNGIVAPAGDQANRFAVVRTREGEAWRSLTSAATAVALSLIEFDDTQTLKRVALTAAQRTRHSKRLLHDFPTIAKRGGSTQPLESAAGILYDFLSDKKWRSHDVPFAPT